MSPMFVSFTGLRKGLTFWGWVELNADPIRNGKDIEHICNTIEESRGYDKGSVVIINFQRLEN